MRRGIQVRPHSEGSVAERSCYRSPPTATAEPAQLNGAHHCDKLGRVLPRAPCMLVPWYGDITWVIYATGLKVS